MLYIKQIVKQDLTKEIALKSQYAKLSFNYDATDISLAPRDILLAYTREDSFDCKDQVIKLDIHIPANSRGDEARFSSPLKNFLLKNKVEIGDIIVFICGNSDTNFGFYCVSSKDDDYDCYKQMLEIYEPETRKGSHKLVCYDCEYKGPLQLILYGAPGTGKSHKISTKFPTTKENSFRTTFHPDTDYASFVGCYKPISKSEKQRFEAASYTKEELHDMYVNFKPTASSRQEICFASMYFKQMQPLSLSDRAYIVGLTVGDPMLGELTKGFAAGEAFADTYLSTKKEITYEFTPQVFTNAYVEAWKKHAEGKPVFLIIEEINRGNCAQIFGDLFQLLDRDDDGYSKYEIRPDSDLENYIKEQKLNIANIVNTNGVDISEDLNNGKLLKLPKNLVILATMNTSDQSLFPMDSAFKRRWDWEYVPIDYKDASQFSLALSEEKNWSDFLQSINAKISKDLHSSAKQLGNRFVNPSDKIITIDMFINKVLFYLFNDAYKDDEDFARYFFGQGAGDDAKLFEDIYADGADKDGLCKKFIDRLLKDYLPKTTSATTVPTATATPTAAVAPSAASSADV